MSLHLASLLVIKALRQVLDPSRAGSTVLPATPRGHGLTLWLGPLSQPFFLAPEGGSPRAGSTLGPCWVISLSSSPELIRKLS